MRQVLLLTCFIPAILACAPPLYGAGKPMPGVHPIIEASADTDNFFGGSVDGQWVENVAMLSRVKGGERYRLYSDTRFLGITTGGKPVYDENEPGSPHIAVELPSNMPAKKMIIGVCGEWNALPRVPKAQSTAQPAYRQVIRDILTRHTLPHAPVSITRVLRVDLEGDGTDEVLICASNPRGYDTDLPWDHNTYSLVLLRKLVNRKVVTIPLHSMFYRDAPDKIGFTISTLEAVLDVNGDGVMEILTGWQYGEGRGMTIHQLKGTGVEEVLWNGWGV